MTNTRITESFAFIFGYIVLSFVMFMIDTYPLSLWLGFNVALAVIPFIIINSLSDRLNKRENKFDIISWLLLIGFVFFLPNTFYVITDMIHINSDDFYHILQQSGTTYRDNIEAYMLIVHIFISAVIGVYLGVKSLIGYDRLAKLKIRDRYTRGVFFVGLLVLSSIGIYIGRFLRFFSWDVLNPFKIIPQVLESVDLFFMTFVLLFTIVQYLLFYGYKLVFEEEPFK